MKRLHNRIAESGIILPVAGAYALGVWLAGGLLTRALWAQGACFVATVFILVELSNQNALLRVRSRMVSSVFIMLTCTACFLFPSLTGALVQMCFAAMLLLLFPTYQNNQDVSHTYSAFLFMGLASLAWMEAVAYLPVLWVLMATQLQSLSWRTWLASLLGLLTPYWLVLMWLVFRQDVTPLTDHLAQLASGWLVSPALLLSPGVLLPLLFALVLSVIGQVHFWQFRFEDKIHTRLLYGFFTVMVWYTVLLMAAMPQHVDVLLRLLLVAVSPLIAHVLTLARPSRLTAIFFFAALALAVVLAAFNLYLLYA